MYINKQDIRRNYFIDKKYTSDTLFFLSWRQLARINLFFDLCLFEDVPFPHRLPGTIYDMSR